MTDEVLPYIKAFSTEQNEAARRAASDIDGSPEDAQRSLELSKASGVPAPQIAADLEGYDKQYRSELTSHIIRSNPDLQEYINGNPMAGQLSNDDWGRLDKLSQSAAKWRQRPDFFGSVGVLGDVAGSAIKGAIRGFEEGFGQGGIGASWLDEKGIKDYPLAASAFSVIGAPAEGVIRLLSAGVKAVMEGAKEGTQSLVAQTTGDPVLAQRLGREAAGFVEWKTNEVPPLVRGASISQAQTMEALRVFRLGEPWLKQGKMPPPGTHKVWDEIHKDQTKRDAEAFNEYYKDVQDTATRERSPDMMANGFLKQYGNNSLAISIEGQLKLFGDDPITAPEKAAKMFDWDPEIADKVRAAYESGSDLDISMPDFLARTDPEVYREIKDDLRLRKGGLTTEEAKKLEVNPLIEQMSTNDPMEALRQQAHLAPSDYRELKMVLERKGHWTPTKGGTVYTYDLSDENGNLRGRVSLIEAEDGKSLFVDSIAAKGLTPNEFGTKLIRDIFRQIKEAFPNAEELVGFRISGARKGAGTTGPATIRLGDGSFEDLTKLIGDMKQEVIKERLSLVLPPNAKPGGAPYKPAQAKTKIEPLYTTTVSDLLDHITLRPMNEMSEVLYKFMGDRFKELVGDVKVVIMATDDIQKQYEEARGTERLTPPGLFDPVTNTIVLADRAFLPDWGKDQGVGLDRLMYHEAVHAVTTKALELSPEINSSVQNLLNYVKRHADEAQLKQHDYAFSNTHEFMADALSDPQFQEFLATVPLDPATAKELGLRPSNATIWDAVRGIIRDLLERALGMRLTDTALEGVLQIGKLIDSFNQVTGGPDFLKQPAFGKITPEQIRAKFAESDMPEGERAAFDRAAAIGMTKDQYSRYQKLIEQRQIEDLESIAKRAMKLEQKRLSEEWKKNEAEERKEALAALNARPDMAADRYFRNGFLFDESVDNPIKLNTDLLSDDIKGKLPRNYYNKSGVSADDLAPIFGFQSGAELINSLITLNDQLKASGMRPDDFKRRLISIETERRMQAKYGNLEENILEAAKERILSDTEQQILHQETFALASKANLEFTITAEELKRSAIENFNKLNAENVTSDKFIAAAGKAGKEAEMAALKGKWLDAFKFKQQQYFSMLYAREAKDLEKSQAKFDKFTKKYSAREVKGTDQEYTNFVHQLMVEAGLPVKRSVQDIANSIAMDGNTTVGDFILRNQADGWELDLPDSALQGKKIDQMSVQEWREFKDTVESLAYVGRETNKIEVAGQKQDFADFRTEVVANIKQLPVRDPKGQVSGFWHQIFRFDAWITRTEEMVKDLDLRKEMGPLWRAVIEPMMSAKHKEYQLQEALTKKMREIQGYNKEWVKTLNDSIPQNFFVDPVTGTLFDIDRQRMINIMLNFGTRSNIEKFTKGWFGKDKAKEFEGKLREMFERHATPEDWKFVQEMWDIFKGWKKEADVMYHNLSGLAPKSVSIEPMMTKHGTFDGGYFPIIYDQLRSNIESVKDSKSPLDGNNYYRATTSNRYTKDRTGYVDRVEFDRTIEMVVSRMQQQIHDIAYRPAVMQVGKVVYDKAIMNAIRNHYGKEYADQLVPWLKDIANHTNFNEKANAAGMDALRRGRMNLTGHALGFNFRVIGSPDVGMLNPVAIGRYLMDRRSNYDMAFEKSKELPHTFRNMDRDYREMMERIVGQRGFDRVVADAVRLSFAPLVWVSQRFRIITFVDQYNKALAKGLNDQAAAELADSYVRERHGSTGTPDLPAVMRGNEWQKAFTIFYGFFNTMYNWQRQMPGQLRRREFADAVGTLYGSVLISAAFGAMLFNKSEKDDSWFKIMAKSLALAPLQTLPFVRDAASMVFEGFAPKTPLVSVFDTMIRGAKDVTKIVKGEGKTINKPIKDAADVVGMSTGLPLGQIGRTGQFAYDVSTGKDKPKNILEYVRGIIHGESKQR